MIFIVGILLAAPLVAAASLDSVLAEQANLTTFRGLVKNYADIFRQLPQKATIIAPSDNAFIKVPGWDGKNVNAVTPVLQYHVLAGEVSLASIPLGNWVFAHTLLNDTTRTNVTGGQNVIITNQPGNVVVFTSGLASRTTVLKRDIPFDGGLIQVVDSLMVIPASLEVTARDAYTDLASFVGALYAADLTGNFSATFNGTFIIPRSAAFQQLAGTFASMSKDKLSRVLHYHVLPGKVVQSGLLISNATFATTLSGERVRVQRFNNDIFVNSAKIIQTDILVANGVVQMIDNVLNPDEADAQPNFTASEQVPVFTVGSISTKTGTAVATPFVSNLPCTASCPVSTASREGGSGKTTGGVRSSSSKGGVAGATCTGAAGAGVGVGAALAVLGMEWIAMV